ncbi:Uncharacterised protein [Mycolicibacterium aurum]|uniref:Uncharacterized protein n=1 Tax=Mycolicibacterium aurum TaxID=1791 RepID=A0A3S4TA22_MYCAU|nr:Uncharacterised protein [Mycolicibacterium aurum]
MLLLALSISARYFEQLYDHYIRANTTGHAVLAMANVIHGTSDALGKE